MGGARSTRAVVEGRPSLVLNERASKLGRRTRSGARLSYRDRVDQAAIRVADWVVPRLELRGPPASIVTVSEPGPSRR